MKNNGWRRPWRRNICVSALVAVATTVSVAAAEIVYLNNGDKMHGTVVAANNTELTLKTDYGQLVIPKKDIQTIDYGGGADSAAAPATEPGAADVRSRPVVAGDRSAISLSITGRSFWYAFESGTETSTDVSIRLRLYVGSVRACTFVDEKPDTVDGGTLYNSFTFSPTDSQVIETAEGYLCTVSKAEDGEVELRVELPPESSDGRQLVRMLYQINAGDGSFPDWSDVVSRSFSIEVAPGKEAAVVVEQNADALEYAGFFKKKMKNLELFQLSVLSSELRD